MSHFTRLLFLLRLYRLLFMLSISHLIYHETIFDALLCVKDTQKLFTRKEFVSLRKDSFFCPPIFGSHVDVIKNS